MDLKRMIATTHQVVGVFEVADGRSSCDDIVFEILGLRFNLEKQDQDLSSSSTARGKSFHSARLQADRSQLSADLEDLYETYLTECEL